MSDEVTPLASDEDARFAPFAEEVDAGVPADEVIWEEQTPTEPEPPNKPSFWQRLRAIALGGKDQEVADYRLYSFNRAIEKFPNIPTNYVLRGEFYLEIGEYMLAEADFQRGLELASAEFESSDWGIVAQAMRDRAEAGLVSARQWLMR